MHGRVVDSVRSDYAEYGAHETPLQTHNGRRNPLLTNGEPGTYSIATIAAFNSDYVRKTMGVVVLFIFILYV